jgi:hypothetical protein
MERLTQRQLRRLGAMIADRLAQRQACWQLHIVGRMDQVIEQIQRLTSLRRQLTMAHDRGWNAAAGKIIESLRQCIRDSPYNSAEAERAIKDAKPAQVALWDVVSELQQCQEEFDGLEYTPDGTCLSITTDKIELEGVYLGEFQIALNLSGLSQVRHDSTYHIIALDPHTAASNGDVTHPHVSGEHMCEGDAAAAIGAALASGRIFDFFSLVKNVLNTYNSGSPYVSLSDWEGRPCHDCGYTMNSDDTYFCSSCEEDFCQECISRCSVCDESTCGGCLETCSACGDQMCPSCKTTCPDCHKVLCKGCLDDEQCPCVEERKQHQEQEDEQEHDQSPSPTGDGNSTDGASGQAPAETVPQAVPAAAQIDTPAVLAGAAVLTDGVGEVAVLPRPPGNRSRRAGRNGARGSAASRTVRHRQTGRNRRQRVAGRSGGG